MNLAICVHWSYSDLRRYLVSTTLQFQFHKGLCLAAGEYEPDTPGKLLSDCSLFGSKAAGDILKFDSFYVRPPFWTVYSLIDS